jgi:peptidoglycan/LPS O-acetylase OafA/YrhL
MNHLTNEKGGHLGFLDGIRGWLSVWVLLGHVASAVALDIPVLNSPAKAVDLFMVVSGFLMMFHYRRRAEREPWESAATWRTFWVRRFFRIAPLYYLLLSVSILFGAYFRAEHAEFVSRIAGGHPAAPGAGDDLLHYTFLFGLFPAHCATMPIPDWSISLEMQFYAVFPFLALATRRLGLLSVGALAGLVTVVSSDLLWEVYGLGPPKLLGSFPQPSLLLLKAALFLCGMMASEAMELRRRNSRYAVAAALGSFVLAAAVSGKLVTAAVGTILLLSYPRSAPGHPGIEGALAVVRGLLASRVSRILAERSYSLYLAHTLVLFSAGALLNRIPWFGGASPGFRFAALAAACCVVLAPITWVLLVAVELPGIALGRRLSERAPAGVLRLDPQTGS